MARWPWSRSAPATPPTRRAHAIQNLEQHDTGARAEEARPNALYLYPRYSPAMSSAVTGYPMAGQSEAVASSILLLCRWLTDHPGGATLPRMRADRDFQGLCGRCLHQPTAESIAEAVRVLGHQERLAPGPVVRLRAELLQALDVTSTRWAGDVVAGFTRKRYAMQLSYCPHGWPLDPSQAAYPGHQICASVFTPGRAAHPCEALPVWRVTSEAGRRRTTAFWCEEELPGDYRPAAARLRTPGHRRPLRSPSIVVGCAPAAGRRRLRT